MTKEEVSVRVAEMSNVVRGLRMEIEGWRQHTGSTGEFLIVAVENLNKAIRELAIAIDTSKGLK